MSSYYDYQIKMDMICTNELILTKYHNSEFDYDRYYIEFKCVEDALILLQCLIANCNHETKFFNIIANVDSNLFKLVIN